MRIRQVAADMAADRWYEPERHSLLKSAAESTAGFFLSVNASTNITKLRIPYPQTGTWYLSLRSLCATKHG